MTVWKFDFGEGALAAGYHRVDSSTFFHLEREFGWTDRAEIQTRDRRANNQILGTFVVATSPATLRVILDPGSYILHVIMGDKDYSGHVLQLKLSDTDEIFPALTAEAGEYVVLRTVVDVPTSFLDLTFSSPADKWVLNSVTLEPNPGRCGTGVKVVRRKFGDRFEGSVASEHVAAKGDGTGPSPKRSSGDLVARDSGNSAAASSCADTTLANPTSQIKHLQELNPQKVDIAGKPNDAPKRIRSPRSVAFGRRIVDPDDPQGVVTRMICVIRSWVRGGGSSDRHTTPTETPLNGALPETAMSHGSDP